MRVISHSIVSLAIAAVLMLLTVGAKAANTWSVALDGSGDFTTLRLCMGIISL